MTTPPPVPPCTYSKLSLSNLLEILFAAYITYGSLRDSNFQEVGDFCSFCL
jgi:hypothetical protein